MIARNAAVAAVMDVSAGEEAEDEVALPTCKSPFEVLAAVEKLPFLVSCY